MNNTMKLHYYSLSLLACLTLVSCKSEKKTGIDSAPAAPEQISATVGTSFENILLATAPTDAITITEARKNPVPGTELVISGDIIGRLEVFVDNRALLTLGDPAVLTSCNRNPADACATPWDVCCDDPDLITKSIATIQVVDADGKLIKSGLKGLGNMKELSSLIVQGTVAEGSNAENLIINASGIHIASVEANDTPR